MSPCLTPQAHFTYCFSFWDSTLFSSLSSSPVLLPLFFFFTEFSNGVWSSQITRIPVTTPTQQQPFHDPQNLSFHPNPDHHLHYYYTAPPPPPQPEEQNPSHYLHHQMPTTSSYTSLPHHSSYPNPNPSHLVRVPWEHDILVPSSSSSYHSYSYPSSTAMDSYHHLGTGVRGGQIDVDFPTKETISHFPSEPLVGGTVAITSHSNLLEQPAPIPFDGVQGTSWWQEPYPNWHRDPNFSGTSVKNCLQGPSKVVHTAYCEICKIHCNSQETLKSHRYGKNDKKNLEKLRQFLMLNPPKTVEPILETTAVNDNKSAKRKSGPSTAEDLEIKKMKVLEGGAAADAVKTCTICNVVCNSDVVFKYHLEGKKHLAMVKKQQQSLSSL